MNKSFSFGLVKVGLLVLLHSLNGCNSEDPTQGFVELPFNKSYYYIQKPYNLNVSDRYSFVDGIHKLWVYFTDKPLARSSPTRARSEVIIDGYNYTSGVWQFEGSAYVASGTSGACIMQVFGAEANARITTAFMLRMYNGTLKYYTDPEILPDMYDKWFRLNVIHDMDAAKVMAYIDGQLLFEGPDRGGQFHFFKFGVYAQYNGSDYMESRWKDIRIFNKPGSNYHHAKST
ncbi:Citrate-binding protein [Euphorbia peplus]|nr:Citrate-binding protein [Euphorbia peplus]